MVASRPVYAIVGSDRFLRAAALEELLKTLSKEADDLGPIRVSGEGDLADVLDEVRTPSLLGGKRVVVVEDADDFISTHRKALERYVAEPSLDGCLIFLCDSMPKTTNLHKLIAKHGEIRECEPLKGQAFTAWMTKRCATVHGKRLADNAARRLRELIGAESGWIDTELSKLAAYVGERPEITLADVNAATGESREEKVFEVVNALADGNISAAIGAWQQVLATDRAAIGRALPGIAYKVRDYLNAHRDLAANVPPMAVAKRFFVDWSVLRKRLDNLTKRRLMAMQRSLLDADYAIKTGASTLEVAMEKFLVEHGGAPQLYAKAG